MEEEEQMAGYNLNEELKKRKQGAEAVQAGLDDVSRVKVLSPGRQVFKRFIRNRLAVFGAAALIALFLFSFVGPYLYPYGQKQIFYKHEKQKVNYALAKENTAWNGYPVDESIQVERSVVNAMNSSIKKMLAEESEQLAVLGEENGYQIRREAPGIYTLSQTELTQVASLGNSRVRVGTYVMIGKQFTFEKDEIPGLAKEAAANIKGAGGSFTFDGAEYTFEKGDKPKTYAVYTRADGLNYTGEEPGGSFEKDLSEAAAAGQTSFASGKQQYLLIKTGERQDIYRAGEAKTAMVYTNYTLDTYATGEKVPEELRARALMAASKGGGSFQAGGAEYTIEAGDGVLLIRGADGKEYAEFGLFSIRRYSGEDTMSYQLKQEIAGQIEGMLAEGARSGTLVTQIPMQEADGSYSRDEDGDFILSETQMTITQRLEGEYVIVCDQINYVIDIFAAPSASHILGTDSDGFDVLARVMYGGRISMMVGFIVVIIETFLGVIMGGLAGYFGGWVDNLIMRLVDIFYCLPSLPIMIILGAMMDAIRLDTYIRLIVMMAALGLMGWAGVARMVRGQILSLREQEFMVATEATGIRIRDRIFKHLIPNVMPQLIVIATMGLGGIIITESTLSFLGLGVKHPLATWGTIINSVSSASAMAHYAFIWIPVGLLICLTVIAFNFVGDGLRDAYDPKAKR